MTRLVFCSKLAQESPGLGSRPFPGTLGERVYNHISEKAWKLWLAHQTMLINENRLNLMDQKSRAFLQEEMEKFLFGQSGGTSSG